MFRAVIALVIFIILNIYNFAPNLLYSVEHNFFSELIHFEIKQSVRANSLIFYLYDNSSYYDKIVACAVWHVFYGTDIYLPRIQIAVSCHLTKTAINTNSSSVQANFIALITALYFSLGLMQIYKRN